ncbi:MAG: 16S rRNA (guanine(527)-N(7))-methyltransferase RsmG [Aestuariivita sp.]|nr:16S rRNA (guanine(527)-N(7))-methyltransferase RsmG [Aestuariivita sp.]
MSCFLFDNLSVSRETIDRLESYESLVKKWSKGINLISPATQSSIWGRHILDSAQLYTSLHQKSYVWVDLGSGAGFPGLVISIIAKQHHPELNVFLVESDKRKSAFLRTVVRELSLCATVVNDRIENANVPSADIISARALTNLTGLLAYSYPHIRRDGVCLFQKGENWEKEVAEAEKKWSFDLKIITSKTRVGAVTLQLGDIRRG